MMVRTATWIGVVCAVATASWLWLPSRSESAPPPPASKLLREPRSEIHATFPAAGRAPWPAAAADDATEPTIDVPPDPPPAQEHGDDRSRSGLPPALFDKRATLQSQGPTSDRLATVATRMHHAIPDEVLEHVRTSFRKRDEEAALAIGRFRMGTLSEIEAMALVARAQDDYRRETITTLGISPREYAAIFERD